MGFNIPLIAAWRLSYFVKHDLLQLFKRKKKTRPFAFLFERLHPKDFLFFFQKETPQALAFILSFAPNKNYVEKLLSYVEDAETRQYLTDNLFPPKSMPRDVGFVKAVEDGCREITGIE
jgi:hypothetical protein